MGPGVDLDTSGCGIAFAMVCLLVIIGACVLLVGPIVNAVEDARVSIANAQAREAQARADVARERTEQKLETDLHRETMFYAWTVALKSFVADPLGQLLAVVVGAAVAIAGGYAAGRWHD